MENLKTITVEEYQKLLISHDWTYEYSDDHTAWERGSEQRSELNELKKGRPELEALFTLEYNKRFKV